VFIPVDRDKPQQAHKLHVASQHLFTAGASTVVGLGQMSAGSITVNHACSRRNHSLKALYMFLQTMHRT
jgi:hypothetical protein